MGSFINPADEDENEELYKAFITSHEARLRFLAIPECKWRTLCRKLNLSIFDAGDYFIYAQEESSDDEDSVSVNNLRVYTGCAMSQESPQDIYLIDHAWTYTLETAKTMLEENSALVERMGTIMENPNIEDISTSNKIKMILDKMWLRYWISSRHWRTSEEMGFSIDPMACIAALESESSTTLSNLLWRVNSCFNPPTGRPGFLLGLIDQRKTARTDNCWLLDSHEEGLARKIVCPVLSLKRGKAGFLQASFPHWTPMACLIEYDLVTDNSLAGTDRK